MPIETPGPSERAELETFLASAPFYYQPWWLEVVSPGNWDYAVVRRSHEIAAVLPFVKQACGFGQVALGMPQMTQTLGPWLRLSETEYSMQLAEQTELMAALIDALPQHSCFRQNFHYTITNWLPFHWKGFTQTTGYTYVLQDLNDLDAIWNGFDPDVRWNVGKAQKQAAVVDDLDIETFNEVRVKSFVRQGMNSVWPLEFIARVDEACRLHNAGKKFFAVGADKRIHAVAYIIYSPYAAYYVLGGGDPALRDSGANFLLIWEAIRFARGVAKTFDFEMDAPEEGIEHFCRLFGGKLLSYYRVARDRRGPLSKAWSLSRHLVRRTARALRS
jgi:hypothetical protein